MISCVSALVVLTAAPTEPAKIQPRLDAFIEKGLGLDLAPGLAIAVVQGKDHVYTRGFGLADRDSGRRVTPETVFYVASTTKSFTALAAALLHERKLLDLDAPMSRYLKTVRLRPPLSPDGITLRDLLTHTHGISNAGPVVFRTAYSGDFTNAQLIELLSAHAPSSKGGAFSYGNLGYVVAGLAMEAATGRGWKEIVEQEVLSPLGMEATSAWRSRVASERLALPHAAAAQGFERRPEKKVDANMHAAGGHFTTVVDLARYLEAQLDEGKVGGRAVLPAKVLAETRRQQADQDRAFGDIRRFGWGLGWDLGRLDGELLLHRFGGFPGYRSHLSFLPERGLGVAVLVNETGLGGRFADLVAAYAYAILLGRADADTRYEAKLKAMGEEATAFRRKVAADAADRKARTLSRPPKAYAGVYESPRLGRIELRVEGSRLEARMGVLESDVEVLDAALDKLRVELTGEGSVLQVFFAPGGVATRLVFQEEEFTRTGA
jgi:CubicO group peptidase (beta-lactamase class C family)